MIGKVAWKPSEDEFAESDKSSVRCCWKVKPDRPCESTVGVNRVGATGDSDRSDNGRAAGRWESLALMNVM